MQDTLRERVGMVLQEPYLFSDTVLADIRYARLDATDDECIAAARAASAHLFIVTLPDGYHTDVGTHDDLMAAKGFYHDLYLSQFRGGATPAVTP